MSYKVSVIVPIYNAENNLKKTIQSVINQSIGFENIELILVDDASTDNSKKIIETYCEKYDNIIPYYSEKNHGSPGFGRNMGLNIATSDFLMFIDNDDEYEENICKKLYETIINENADIVCCNKISVDTISTIKQHIPYTNGIENNDNIIIKGDDILFFDSVAVWNKIYKKELIKKNGLKFLENTRADDFAFTIDYYLNCEKLIFLKNYHGYYWNIQSTSLSHTVTPKHIQELIETYKYTFRQLKLKRKEQYMNKLIKSDIEYLILQSSYLNVNKNEFIDSLNEIRNFEKEIGFNLKLNTTWVEVINNLILNKHYDLSILLLKSIDKLRKITILRKINRKI